MLNSYLLWWYGKGIEVSASVFVTIIHKIADFFSLRILVRTWFAPWKNDTLSAQRGSLSDKFKIWQLNMATRFIGFFVRTFIIAFGLIVIASCVIFAVALELIYLAMPISILLLPVIAVLLL